MTNFYLVLFYITLILLSRQVQAGRHPAVSRLSWAFFPFPIERSGGDWGSVEQRTVPVLGPGAQSQY